MKVTRKERIRDLFSDKIWSIDTKQCSKLYAEAVRLIRLTRITISTFEQNKMGFQCVALSYFVVMAMVPLIAMMIGMTGSLGLEDNLTEILYRFFPGNNDFVGVVIDKANDMVEGAKKGGVALISSLTFLWAVIWMMFQVERVFNNVWGITKIPRKLYKRFGFYILVLILSPFLVILFGTGITFYSNITNLVGLDLSDLKILPKFLGYLGFYIITTFTLSAMYTFIPATRVKYRHALKSAAIAALVFIAFQYLYLETQVFVGRLSFAYGVIAAIPLFLTWLNFSWWIIIYGAELTYGYHNIEKYNTHDWDSDKKI